MTAAPTYTTLLRLPGAAAFFAAACAGRVGIAMTGLGLVWLVHGATGSYAAAGVVTGAFAIAEAVVGPQAARLVDRHGQTRVLPVLVGTHAGAVAVLLLAVGRGAPTWSLAAVAVLAGGGHPALGSVGAATLVVAGALVLASRRESAPLVAGRAGADDGLEVTPDVGASPGAVRAAPPVRVAPAVHGRPGGPAFIALVGVALGMGTFFGANQVSVAAFAVEAGRPTAATALYAVGSVSGLLTAWAYGLRRWRAAPHRQLVAAALALALGCVPLVLVARVLPMAAALAAAGAAVPVVLVLSSVLVQQRVDPGVLTEAFTWLNSATAAGSAGAAALAGTLVDAGGARAGLAVALAAGVAVALLAVGAAGVLGAPSPAPR